VFWKVLQKHNLSGGVKEKRVFPKEGKKVSRSGSYEVRSPGWSRSYSREVDVWEKKDVMSLRRLPLKRGYSGKGQPATSLRLSKNIRNPHDLTTEDRSCSGWRQSRGNARYRRDRRAIGSRDQGKKRTVFI